MTRSMRLLSTAFGFLLLLLGLGSYMVWATTRPNAAVERPTTSPPVVVAQTQATAPSTAPPSTSAPELPTYTTPTEPVTPAAAVAPRTNHSIAFCGPRYDASPAEWSALRQAGIGVAFPPCSSYPHGQPVPWPVWDGSVRYMGFEPFDSVPQGSFQSYLDEAGTYGIKVFAFAPQLFARQDAAGVLADLPSSPSLVGWVLPEEPSAPEQIRALVPAAAALHAQGLIVHLNFALVTPELIVAAQALDPDWVSNDDYASLDRTLTNDAMLHAGFPNAVHQIAVRTVQYDCTMAPPSKAEVEQWVTAIKAQGAEVLWFTWNVPELAQSCPGYVDGGEPWYGGLYPNSILNRG